MGSSSGYSCQSNAPIDVCPSTVSVGTLNGIKWTPGQGPCSTTPLNVVGCLTGVGADVQMTVGPSSANWNNTSLTEALSPTSTSNPCPTSVTKLTGNICNAQPGRITVGIGATDPSGTALTATKNAFWDIHGYYATQDTLGLAGVSGSCNIACSQTYSCAGEPISPSFTITYTFKHTTTSSGTPVTQVTVTKAAQ